ncbi:IclR family transcriptional regulator [Rhizobium lusitanum]|jgi:DNA-binding IclR family transcriptional regulator|uniref:IclR family transcriptional regulator n=1 Tax=Rhizobium lusitanum TaxID=293958 RepID=UPI001571AABE|nr:IclR family transcriptional regulator [Rhizobium lusitanum]NTJ09330.1 IclR family transcriptional regulator [Rhizobium lusitanum]
MSTVGKALTLLDRLSQLNTEPGLTDVARICGLDKATARRLLVELEKHGFVEQDPETRKYRIGATPVRLARVREARYPFLRVAIPFVKDLAGTSEETVHLSEFAGGQLSTIHVEDSPRAHRVIVDVGTHLPFHATASGLAYLAFSGRQQIETVLSQSLKSFTDYTVTDPSVFRKMLTETAERGFSISNQGLEIGVVSTAAPICSPTGQPIGAVAIAAPLTRASAAVLKGFGASVADTAKRISEKYYGSERPSGTRT